jgi:hypothetical protein
MLTEASLKLPQVEVPVRHYFSEGVYGREMYVPKGTIITGAIHKFSTIDVLLEGSILVVSDDGVLRQLDAPMVIESHPGFSKAGRTLTDVRWITFHGSSGCKDVPTLLQELVVGTHEQYLEHCANAPKGT